MDKLKRDPSYSIDAIRPVTHVCKAHAARAHRRRSNHQSEKTIKDIYKTIDRCAIKWLFKVFFSTNSFCVLDTSFQTLCFALFEKITVLILMGQFT